MVVAALLLAGLAGALALTALARRSGRRTGPAAAAGAAAGAGGGALFQVPLGFCTFEAGRPAADVGFGLFLMAVGVLLGLRLAWTLLDPAGAAERAKRGDSTTHGVFRGHPFLPWVLLAPTLAVLIVFLYWPALRTARLSTMNVRLGAPRTADRCVTNFTELIGLNAPQLAGVALLATAVAFTLAVALRRRARAAVPGAGVTLEKYAGWASTAGVFGALWLLYLLWTPGFQRVYVVTLIISAGTVVLGLSISLAVAYLAYQPIRGASLYRTLLVWPYAISPPIAGLIFFVIFDPNAGIVEHWLGQLFGISLPNYRQNALLAQIVVILASVWKTLGYNLLFYIAGLQTVPGDQLEAAELDGANAWQRFRHVVVPALSPITFFLVVTNLTYAFFDTFGTIDYLTRGGPAGETSVLMYEIYLTAIPGRDLGRGAAQSMILFAGVIALTVWQFRSTGRRVSYGR
ncbi:carbohydrate ABC transporter permease [Egicoccus sp. AB-alg2]|uniref:carbohydrate ABC transporter permease n=1 Tax=Egicoccus sp. AB-alg2 TaxID=3242693 RepID=UPI00359E247F